MVSERLKTLFGRVKKGLSNIKAEDVAKFAAKEAVGAIPVVGQIIKNIFDEFSPDEKEELIKELKELSESQFKEIGEVVGVSVEYLKDIQGIALYTFEELRADHEEIIALLRHLIKIQTTEITIPTIQSVLRKTETTEADFFKKEPEWIDFEEGFVVERREVAELIKKLENDNIQLVLGEPASGKSIILKNIGFKLANENKDVYVVELKKHSWDEVKRYFDDIFKIKDGKAVFIVDDAHLYLSDCERLVKDFKNRKLHSKLIIGSRPTGEIQGGHPKEVSEFEYLSKTDIHAEDVTEKMVRRFLKRKYGFRNERIEIVSKNLKEYKKDLWSLSWALKAYNPEKDSVEEKEIYEKIRDSIREIKLGKDESGKDKFLNAEDIFLPLSVFYRFEIPVERDFLEEQLEIEKDKLNELIELSEIIETEEIGRNRMLSHNHSSIAKLHFKTYQSYPDLGGRIKNDAQKRFGDWYIGLFHVYFQVNPSNCCDALRRLWDTDIPDKLMENKETKEAIIKGIKNEKNIEKIARCLDILHEKKEILGSLSIPDLIAKLNDLVSEAPFSVGSCIFDFSRASKELAKKLAEGLDVVTLKTKLNDLEFPIFICNCAWGVSHGSKRVGRLLIENLKIEDLRGELEKEESISAIGLCLADLSDIDKKFAKELVKWLNIISLRTKIENEQSVVDIRDFLEGTKRSSEKIAKKLVESLDLNNLILKFNKEDIPHAFASSLLQICDISKEIAEKMVNDLDLATVKTRLEKKGIVGDIDYSLLAIFNGNKEVGKKFIRSLDIANLKAMLENEENIEVFDSCIFTIFLIDKELAYELVNSMDTQRLKAKVDEEQNQEKIARLALHVYLIYKANGESALNKVFNELLAPLLCFLDKDKKERYERFYKSLLADVVEYMHNLVSVPEKEEKLPETHFLFPESYHKRLLVEVSKVDRGVREAILSLTALISEARQFASYFEDL